MTVYKCLKCKKLYKNSIHATKCCNSTYQVEYLNHNDDLLETVLSTLVLDSIVDSVSDIFSSSSGSDDFSGGGGDFGGGSASGDW